MPLKSALVVQVQSVKSASPIKRQLVNTAGPANVEPVRVIPSSYAAVEKLAPSVKLLPEKSARPL